MASRASLSESRFAIPRMKPSTIARNAALMMRNSLGRRKVTVCAGIQNQTHEAATIENMFFQSMLANVPSADQREKRAPFPMSVSVNRWNTIMGKAKITFMKNDFQNAASRAEPAPE